MGQAQRLRQAHSRLSARAISALLAAGGLSFSILSAGEASAASAHSAKVLVISAVKNAKYGTILVSGTTVYAVKPGKTPCGAKCLKVWPEVLLPKGVTKAVAGAGVIAAKLGTIRRGGALQVTYSGKALYWFSKDTRPGQVKGVVNDKWGKWSVVAPAKPANAAIAPSPVLTTTSTTKAPIKAPPPSGTSTTGTAPTTTTAPPTTTTTIKPSTTTTTSGGTGGTGF